MNYGMPSPDLRGPHSPGNYRPNAIWDTVAQNQDGTIVQVERGSGRRRIIPGMGYAQPPAYEQGPAVQAQPGVPTQASPILIESLLKDILAVLKGIYENQVAAIQGRQASTTARAPQMQQPAYAQRPIREVMTPAYQPPQNRELSPEAQAMNNFNELPPGYVPDTSVPSYSQPGARGYTVEPGQHPDGMGE